MVEKSRFVGKKCKVFFNDTPEHVAWIEGKVLEHSLVSKFVVVKDIRIKEPVGIYAIKIIEVLK